MKTIQALKRHRNSLLLLAALALGALAAFGTRGYIAREIAAERERLQPRGETVRIVVAKTELARGDVASAQTMATREVPREFVPGSALRPEQFEGYVGARLAAPMRAGEPLLQASLEGADIATFSSKVKSGIRALTVAVDEINSLSGMLQPGDRIDLMLSVRLTPAAGGVPAQELTRPLMQDLKVLATGRQVRPGGDERQGRTFTAITIEVTPEQAQRLVVAQRSGKLTAMLRNPGDHAPIAQRALDVYGLLGLEPATRVPENGPASPDLIVGGRGPLKVVAGLASAVQSAAGSVLSAMRFGPAPGMGGESAGGWPLTHGVPVPGHAAAAVPEHAVVAPGGALPAPAPGANPPAVAGVPVRVPDTAMPGPDLRLPDDSSAAPRAQSITFR